MNEDTGLLRQFVEERSEAAFTELVRRKVTLVYSAALRQTGGDAHLAQDVAQGVFLLLAGRAATLRHHTALTGWLYTTTRFLAHKARRAQRRRQQREQEANAMESMESENDRAWTSLRPVLDEAMHELGERDREALLLRFFEGRPLAEVGAAIGLAENSARMRVDRALEKLRGRLARRGITSTAAALAATLAAQSSTTVPAGVAAGIAASSLAGALVAGGSAFAGVGWIYGFMSTAKLAWGAAGVALAFGIGTMVGGHRAPENPAGLSAGLVTSTAAVASSGPGTGSEKLAAAIIGPGRASVRKAEWQILADLKQKKMISSEIAFVAPTGKLEDAFATTFELSPAERTALEEALNKASAALANLQRENATITRHEQKFKGVTIAIRPFVAPGRELYDETMSALARTLGPERHAAFLSLAAEQVEKALFHFGAEDRKLTLFYGPGLLNGPYFGMDRVQVGSDEESTSALGSLKFSDIERRFGSMARLIPADFGER